MQTNTQSTEGKDPHQTTGESSLDDAACSAFDLWWNDQENGCPPLVLDNDEQFARAVWNAAIKVAAAAEEIGYSIRRLSVPNVV